MQNKKGQDRKQQASLDDLMNDSTISYGGEALRAEREKAGVDIPTLSFELRIPKNYLHALEAETYDELPGATYGYGYIKSYCKFLGIDDTPFLDTYKMRTSAADSRPEYSFPDEALEPRMSGAMTAMLVVLVLLTGYIGWQVFDRYQGAPTQETTLVASIAVQNEPAGAEVAQVTDVAPAPNAESAPVEDETSSDKDESVAAPQEETQTASVETNEANDAEAAPKADAVAESQTQETQTASATQSDTEQTNVAQTVVAQKPSDDEQPQQSSAAQANVRVPAEEIVISASSAAWVEVVSENGDVILSKLFQEGEDYVAPANQKLYLSTGNAGGLVLLIPGLDAFQAGAVGEIIRDLPLSRESIRSRRSAVTQ